MSDILKTVLPIVIDNVDLSRKQAYNAIDEIMSGNATQAQIGAFITALRMKGETVEEITGCAIAMREKSLKIKSKQPLTVDTCGTGGDCSGTVNISTISAFVAAGAGIPISKHGNRSISSKCGSADVLSELGVNISAPLDTVERCLNEIGIAFMFAPIFHSAMKHAIGPRREIGIRTVFNILGPLTNPAGAQAQVLGVYDESLTEVLAQVLNQLGIKRAFVVHGNDGLDEITTTDLTRVSEVKDHVVTTYNISPEDFGLKRSSLTDLAGNDAAHNALIVRDILSGKKGSIRDIIILNAAFAIVAGEGAGSIEEGIKKAEKSLDTGLAQQKLENLIEYTQTKS